jgi:cyanophycinase
MRFLARISVLVVILLAVANLASASDEVGSLVIIGGGLRYDQSDVWNKTVELAGGRGAKIAVFPTASGDPLSNGSRTAEALRAAGAEPFLVPVRVVNSDLDYRQAVMDPKLAEEIKSAGGVYFIGGSQERITTALGCCTGTRTPLLEAIWDVYRKGGVVAGSSAGAAVMSRMMYVRAPSVLRTLQDGVKLGSELGPGLGFLHPDWFVEQHCLARGRYGRALVAMHTLGVKYGIGVDENTAVVVSEGHRMSVLGSNAVVVLNLSEAVCEKDKAVTPFNLKNARISYLEAGDAFDLDTHELTPSEDKRAGQTINPASASFNPFRDEKVVVPDILASGRLADLMMKLLYNRQPEAIGLAFDAAAAMSGPTPGFEFRFYRGDDSRGWFAATSAGGPTVSNIHLDIRPIEITGPLYK